KSGSISGGFTQGKNDQVCSVIDRQSVSCSPDAYDKTTKFATVYADATSAANKANYTCNPGDLGCDAKADKTCKVGTPNEFGTCASALIGPNADKRLGKDVKDQHCRNYFCDDSFACNVSTNKCVRCDEHSKDADGIGCGELALLGKPSTVYDHDNSCQDDHKS